MVATMLADNPVNISFSGHWLDQNIKHGKIWLIESVKYIQEMSHMCLSGNCNKMESSR
jgi:hypothetical protein